MTLRSWIATALVATCSTALPAWADTFVFTAIPDQDERRLNERFGKVADYLADELGVDVDYIPVKSYPAAVSAFRNNQVQMAWFGGLTGVQARQLVPGSQAIAQGEEDTAFKTYFVAHESTGLEPTDTLTDALRDRSFTFGSKGSTSGRLMPEYYLREQFGQAPEQLFSRVGFSGDHSRTIALVESGAYDIGAVNYAVWEAEVEAGEVDTDAVQVIWETPAYPDYQWTLRGDADARFGDGFTQRVQQALLNMTDPDLLAAFPRSGFIPAENADYAPIERTAVTIGIMDAQ
ncbi:putative selenate ABC transporter substrate-binding protein [Saccharospirillum salsuginis]|uniref:Selenate ABC transporter substrate-binding protein n=1 Tax=Saccharospirillum salsuginis TaxID=418750 RepID=A0A918JZY3_9GAMM|nr:putative selenate ABC transporter substrate-binding protein [Saccharospirillum salsuginis]GGX38802.1 putative selenate ABC transporter substrate-binding protein [Saccharospirillum salsuginis]